MMRNVLIGLAVVCLLSSPFAVSALTVEELQAQIQSLVARIAELTGQINVLRPSTAPAVQEGLTVSAPHRICALLYRNLSQGISGDDVAGLQEFLQSEGYFSTNTTGYFGPVTAQAVARWQAAQGISSVGAFGPLSRERLKIWCGGGGSGKLRADPSRGIAPLTVTFAADVNTLNGSFIADGGDYKITFGDGTEYVFTCADTLSGMCRGPQKTQHTYLANGTYVARLVHFGYFAPPNADGSAPSQVLGTATIYVGSEIACTKEYRPVCASKQVQCITTPCYPIQQTYGNSCMARADGATVLYEGSCRADGGDPQSDPKCKSWYDGCNTCSRQYPGGPAMCTLRACMAEMMQRPYCTEYFDGAGNRPPVISGFSGPTSLTLNEQGTWKILSSDPENGSLQYSIRWGDEWYVSDIAGVSSPASSIVQSTTFTHSYATAGTYTITVTVSDSSGQSAQATATVNVSNTLIACTMEYAPVCGRPSGCKNTCPPGMYCALLCQMHDPVTYGNRCQLNAANATFLHEGECTTASSSQY